ncbi:hypothetical protein PFTANZ_05812, partial [Plasmodium falciparum Tanzania (2000708)]
MTPSHCRCGDDKKPDKSKAGNGEVNIVPTYFDYVPQFLRWFEEWAEDFCRLRKHKLKDAIQKCREKDKGDKKLYCDLNRHDCAQTIRGDHVFVEEDVCKYCHFSCSHFVKWIDNQKLEFEKQKNKYTKEITGGGRSRNRKKRSATTMVYGEYERKFYDKFKTDYVDVDKFLEKLNDEEVCKKKLKDVDDKGGKIDFKTVNSSSAKNSGGDDSNKTFSHTEYCQACPWCGAEKDNSRNGNWTPKGDKTCGEGKEYGDYKFTNIPILTPQEQSDIFQKYKSFCESVKDTANGGGGSGPGGGGAGTSGGASGTGGGGSGGGSGGVANSTIPGTVNGGAPGEKGGKSATGGVSQIKTWKCYYDENKNNNDGKKDINFCVLQDGKQHTKDQKDKSYNAFFWDWVHDMLIDSIKWRNEHGKCINKDNGKTCKRGCNTKCDCFLKWVKRKEKEWKQIIDHFYKQKGFDKKGENGIRGGGGLGMTADVVLELLLDKDELLEIIEDTYGKSKETEHIKEMLEKEKKNKEAAATGAIAGGGVAASGSGTGGANGKNTSIDKLLQHEEEIATKCKNCQPTKIRNPCSGDKTGDQRYEAVAQTVAKILQQKAHTDMLQRSGKDGESETDQKVSLLKGEIKNAKLKNRAIQSGLNSECEITKDHSSANSPSNNPCNGKGDGLQIGETWEQKHSRDTTNGEFYLPPRRQHMCTSNLENLNVSWVTEDGKAIHSLLGDVLLAAKYQAQQIITKYKENEGKQGLTNPEDKKTVCRAMKYSFADIGDIIKGTDLWDEDGGEKTTQNKLKTVFDNIYNSLDEEIQKRYTNRENKHLDLRKDWWEANRKDVWKAMQCSKNNDGIYCGATPHDDYIPQRLRWMTEWAEWFCKEQYSLYDKLFMQCAGCKNKEDGKGCTQGDNDCTPCAEACKAYRDKIKTWENQWKQLKAKYEELYLYAKNYSTRMVLLGTDPDYQQMVEFFKELQKVTGDTTRATTSTTITPYSSPEGYIHQELPITGCQIQKEFCYYKNGLTSHSSDAKENKNYAFKNPPHGYDKACKCDTRDQQTDGDPGARSGPGSSDTPPRSEKGDSASDEGEDDDEEEEDEEDEEEEEDDKVCGMVKALIRDNDGKQPIENCNPKEYNNQAYPEWKCDKNSKLVSGDGECMPPRRQKLCLYYLTQLGDKVNEDEFKTAFIKTAAAETFHAWHYYKSKNSDKAKQLDNGTIPEEFLRSMFFTYGDYRDICLNSDISIKDGQVKDAIDNIGKFFSKDGSKSPSCLSRQEWWKKNGTEIWEGMLCALPGTGNLQNNPDYNNPPEDFAKKPQFLRWMIEWGEEFCREREKLEQNIGKSCSGEPSGDGCKEGTPCKNACQKYEQYVKKKKDEFYKQTTKFVQKANETSPDPEYKGYGYIEGKDGVQPIQGNEYLLKNCDTGKCDCMKGNVLGFVTDVKPFGIYAHNHSDKCNCLQGKHSRSSQPSPPPAQPPAQPPPPPVIPAPTVDVCTTVKNALEGKLDDACTLKYGTPNRYWGWKCIPSGTTSGDQKATSGETGLRRNRRDTSGVTTTGSSGDTTGGLCIPPRRRRLY